MRVIFVMVLLSAIVMLCAFSVTNVGHPTVPCSIINQDSLEKDRLKWMNEVMATIKGKEKLPADSVFKNIKVIKGKSSVSAEHFLWMMNWGWSKELGVSCSHCHTPAKWESDSLPTKNIARGMWLMRVQINRDILPSITGLDYEANPKVTCMTCHRGKPIPDTK